MPKSQVLEHGYINVYSQLNDKERRQLNFKLRYKTENTDWDESMVYLSTLFPKLVTADCVVLDAGCGNGNYVIDENRSHIKLAIGIDVSPEVTKKNICLDDIKFGNLEALPFEDSSFDAVLSLWVLEHIKNVDNVLSEIQRVLKPNGYFMFVTPNKNFLPLKIMQLVSKKKLNFFLNKMLFGRHTEDIFPAYYFANTVEDISKAAYNRFEIVELRNNFDPSYLSFNNFTYLLNNVFHKSIKFLGFDFTFAHIVGIMKKK